MNESIKTQILGQIYLTFILACLIFASVVSKDKTWLIISIIFGVLYILFLLQCIRVIKNIKGKKTKDKFPYVYLIVLIIIGVFCFLTTKAVIENKGVAKNGEKLISRVTAINETIRTERRVDEKGFTHTEDIKECLIEIKYDYDGKTYINEYDIMTCNHKVGDKLEIIVDKNDPTKFLSPSGQAILVVSCILCYSIGIFVVFGGVIDFSKLKRKTSKIKNKKKGDKK